MTTKFASLWQEFRDQLAGAEINDTLIRAQRGAFMAGAISAVLTLLSSLDERTDAAVLARAAELAEEIDRLQAESGGPGATRGNDQS